MQAVQLSQCLNNEFINLFTEKYQTSPVKLLQYIKKVHYSKSSQQNKINLIRQFQEKVNKIQKQLHLSPIDFDDLIESTRNTEFNVIITQTLFPNPKGRKIIQEIRCHTLQNLKSPEKITSENFNLLYSIYKKYYFGTQSLSYERINTIDGTKTLKTILISLKKMMVLKPKKTKKTKNISTTQPYYVNIDTRIILQNCETQAIQLMEKKLVMKIKQILQQKKKWVGPRIWKIVQQNSWSNYQIELFISLIQNAYASLNKIKSDPKQLKKHIQKILSNLRTLLAHSGTPSCETEDGIDDEMKQLYSRFEQMENMNAILFEFKDMDQIEEKMQIQRNADQQIFEVDQPYFI